MSRPGSYTSCTMCKSNPEPPILRSSAVARMLGLSRQHVVTALDAELTPAWDERGRIYNLEHVRQVAMARAARRGRKTS